MICSPGTTPTCEPTSKTCRKCVTGCGRTKGLAPARGTVWSTNLVTLAVYVHRIPCRCSSGAHREGTMLVHTMGHDVGNPYTKRWTVRRDPIYRVHGVGQWGNARSGATGGPSPPHGRDKSGSYAPQHRCPD